MSEEWEETGRAEPSVLTGDSWNIEYRIGNMTADVRRDGCAHLRQYWNGREPGETQPPLQPGDVDYIHVCELDAYIARLQALRERIAQDFGSDWP